MMKGQESSGGYGIHNYIPREDGCNGNGEQENIKRKKLDLFFKQQHELEKIRRGRMGTPVRLGMKRALDHVIIEEANGSTNFRLKLTKCAAKSREAFDKLVKGNLRCCSCCNNFIEELYLMNKLAEAKEENNEERRVMVMKELDQNREMRNLERGIDENRTVVFDGNTVTVTTTSSPTPNSILPLEEDITMTDSDEDNSNKNGTGNNDDKTPHKPLLFGLMDVDYSVRMKECSLQRKRKRKEEEEEEEEEQESTQEDGSDHHQNRKQQQPLAKRLKKKHQSEVFSQFQLLLTPNKSELFSPKVYLQRLVACAKHGNRKLARKLLARLEQLVFGGKDNYDIPHGYLSRQYEKSYIGLGHPAEEVLKELTMDSYIHVIEHTLFESILVEHGDQLGPGSGKTITDLVVAVYKRHPLRTELLMPQCRYNMLLKTNQSHINGLIGRQVKPNHPSLLCEAVRYKAHSAARMLMERDESILDPRVKDMKRLSDPNFELISGCTCLMVACFKNDLDMINLLIDNGANVSSKMVNGVSALAVTAFKGYHDATELLLNRGADINIQTSDGTTPLMTAVQENHANVVELLLERGADVNLCKVNGSSPIIVAVRHHRASLISLLAKAGGNPDLALTNGATATVLACANNDIPAVKAMLDVGCDVMIPLNSGATALSYASHRNNKDVIITVFEALYHRRRDPTFQVGQRPGRRDWLTLDEFQTLVDRARQHEMLSDWLEHYQFGKDVVSEVHYACALDDIPRACRLLKEDRFIGKNDHYENILCALSGDRSATYIDRALTPFSPSYNADIWPAIFTTIANALGISTNADEKSAVIHHQTGALTDVASNVLSFCNRDWFD